MLQKVARMGKDVKYAAVSVLSVIAVIVLHLIHFLSAPVMMGAMEMQGHQHGAHGATPQTILFTIALLAVNGAGMYFAVRQLHMAWKQRRRGWHTYMCCTISTAVLIIGVYTIVS
ncbi:hypothetical protein SK3146_06932 [Paenibacillus konkukensis]|uniref:DUF420 domain-containing protein n=1 Tax=Paenibacillus konkukensis TaxID=2020716 RepID=A0ABY4RYY6_9BACL|nr:hypothetical protein [Paenibacillus konkukensis]UQZ87630.1 hypothetical protein SK3146_06932 [Paenibacillus konkukensis]